ncbi:ROK family protein [Arthrobacter sp. TMS2-4]
MDASRPLLTLAVDIGGTKVDASLITADGAVVTGTLHRRPTGSTTSRQCITAAISDAARAAIAGAPAGSSIIGIGIGSAGPVNLDEGTISPKNLPHLHDFAVCAHLGTLLPGRPVTLRLDGTCIALAESWKGATQGSSNSLTMVISTGIGGGIILQNKLIAGRSGNAGHIGQMRLHPKETAHSPIHAGTLEDLASGPQTVAWARGQGWIGASGEDLAHSYEQGDPTAQAAVRRSAAAVGLAIANVATLLDLDVAALGGGFINVSSDYVDLVREAAHSSRVLDYTTDLRIVATALGHEGPLLGAAALIHQSHALELAA